VSRREQLRAWLLERVPAGGGARAMLAGGPSFAYVFGWVLVLLLVVEAITGTALAAFYSPSTTNAWASVAYVQDRMPLGWLVRGLHYHGASALVIVAGVHLAQTAFWGAYRKPREVVWWIGVVLLLLVLGFTITGYVLRWDQAGYWANRVEVGIAAGTPIAGGAIKRLAIGGNEWGNLTLTRFYALHVIVLPGIVLLGVAAHVWLARKHGATPRVAGGAAVARWPAQSLRNVVAMAGVFAVLLAYVVQMHGADLAAPADPSAPYDARPLWYFRWLFELRELTGSYEKVAALVAPALVAGFLIVLPLADRGKSRTKWLGAVAGMLAVIAGLTIVSLAGDGNDTELGKREQIAARDASRARELAKEYGVPATGPHELAAMQPMYRARALFAQKCKGCHDADSNDRKGPIIAAGHGDRAWLRGFLKTPSGPAYWGKTKLGQGDDAMKPVELPDQELDDLVELLYAQSGAIDADTAKRDRGKAIFDNACNECHAIDEGVAGASAPGLGMLGSRDWYTGFIGNPKSTVHMGAERSEMPRFDKDLSIVDRDALAGYLTWLRTATPKDVASLGAL
jgi:ubiquinol-cytochrome c reductase cytochrome b subunit